ncbi:mitochondrial 54S ribosomal protein YmL19 [Malassezia sp. CBS 17886]|nr:mitochondrial 54S ribosomal protein YmL19 [Malassezia sp. CBS 17886]
MSRAGGKAATAAIVKLMVPAGKASAQPPVGPALGAKGVKAMDFAKEFNARTADLEPGLITPTVVTVQPDRTFSFSTLSASPARISLTAAPPTSLLLKRAANITTGARKPGAEVTGTVSIKHIYEIARIKRKDVDVNEKEVCGGAIAPDDVAVQGDCRQCTQPWH